MKALILAGGLGTRLKKTIEDIPKPMAKIGRKPFLEYQIAWLKHQKITDIVLCVGYLWEVIFSYFGDGSSFSLNIAYCIEDVLLGTGGAIGKARKYVDGTFLVLNGDSFVEISLQEMLSFHRLNHAICTMAFTRVVNREAFGAVEIDREGRIIQFQEKVRKPSCGKFINAGVYIFEPEIFRYIPPEKEISLEKEIFPQLLMEGRFLYGYPTSGYFVDIGTPHGLKRAQKELKSHVQFNGW